MLTHNLTSLTQTLLSFAPKLPLDLSHLLQILIIQFRLFNLHLQISKIAPHLINLLHVLIFLLMYLFLTLRKLVNVVFYLCDELAFLHFLVVIF